MSLDGRLLGGPRPRVYAAHPISSYGTEHAMGSLARLRHLLPGAEIVDPEEEGWEAHDDWLRDWPVLLEGLAGLVVFPASDGTIGLGCVRELTDALARRLPVAVLEGDGLRRLDGLRLVDPSWRRWRRFARLLRGPALDPAGFPGTFAEREDA